MLFISAVVWMEDVSSEIQGFMCASFLSNKKLFCLPKVKKKKKRTQ